MSLKVWYPQDIRNAILAAEQASRAALLAGNPDDQFARGYREGHKAALATIAVAFGLIQFNVTTTCTIEESYDR